MCVCPLEESHTWTKRRKPSWESKQKRGGTSTPMASGPRPSSPHPLPKAQLMFQRSTESSSTGLCRCWDTLSWVLLLLVLVLWPWLLVSPLARRSRASSAARRKLWTWIRALGNFSYLLGLWNERYLGGGVCVFSLLHTHPCRLCIPVFASYWRWSIWLISRFQRKLIYQTLNWKQVSLCFYDPSLDCAEARCCEHFSPCISFNRFPKGLHVETIETEKVRIRRVLPVVLLRSRFFPPEESLKHWCGNCVHAEGALHPGQQSRRRRAQKKGTAETGERAGWFQRNLSLFRGRKRFDYRIFWTIEPSFFFCFF